MLFRGNVLPEVLDFLIKDEFELLQLLSLLFQLKNLLLSRMDVVVLDGNLVSFLCIFDV